VNTPSGRLIIIETNMDQHRLEKTDLEHVIGRTPDVLPLARFALIKTPLLRDDPHWNDGQDQHKEDTEYVISVELGRYYSMILLDSIRR
jgi:hypothetical protein